jgi:protocatechuate 3,4-dioxygenase alpha subunit
MRLPRTPSQTVGPFYSVAFPRPREEFAVPAGTAGGFWIRGRITDGAGDPVRDAFVETWQADADGTFGAPDERGLSRGFGRAGADADARYAVFTTRPGRVAGPDGELQAPHIDVAIFARGLLRHLVTRIYFPEETEANARDGVLASITEPAERATLVAAPADDGYTFDIRLQGDGETVFFEP